MSADYWSSSQRRHWLLSRATLSSIRGEVATQHASLVQAHPLPEYRFLSIFFHQQLAKLGRRMSVRQQALATAQVYIRRFYTRVEVRVTNPYLVIATSLYLACKTEECPQHIRSIVSEARNLWPDFIGPDISSIGECEFYIISTLNSQLIVFHPYRTLLQLNEGLKLQSDEFNLSWNIINDHYLTDLPLLHPPHVVACAALFMAMVLKPAQSGMQMANNATSSQPQPMSGIFTPGSMRPPSGVAGLPGRTGAAPQASSSPASQGGRVQALVRWLAESEVSIEAMTEATQDIVSLYTTWEEYSEKTCKEQIARFVRARGLTSQ